MLFDLRNNVSVARNNPAHSMTIKFVDQAWVYTYDFLLFKAAESVSFRNYCMWIFLFYKKLHMSKLSIKVELIPQHKPLYEFRLQAFGRQKIIAGSTSMSHFLIYLKCTRGIWKVMHIHLYNFTQ